MEGFQHEKVKELRAKKQFTQKKLGALLGISDRAVSKWETGLSEPSGQNLVRLARIFGVPVETFLQAQSDEKAAPIPGMESIKELYRQGRGPSSSHTIGPEMACIRFRKMYPHADRFRAVLFGSLAKTGRGHGTDEVIRKTLYPANCVVEWETASLPLRHPNTMELYAYKGETFLGKERIYSVGGGKVEFESDGKEAEKRVYSLYTFRDIAAYCERKDIRLYEYAMQMEDSTFSAYMFEIWETMQKTIKRGLRDTGVLPGGLGVQKKAKTLFESRHIDETAETRENRMVCAYAFAVGEQNASGETIVTAPTAGAAGVLPAVLYYQKEKNGWSDTEIVHALMTAGIVGNLIKTNASISGAECGCQAEVGSACAMAAAALAELFGLGIEKIEYAAEIAIEHHLGLTCDPICGLVQIPCIERNAVAAMRAVNAVSLASFLWNTRKISFDRVVKTMKETGRDMHVSYKETAEGGLAKIKI